MRALGFAHGEARDVELGRICASCAEPFSRAHEMPVLCEFCWRRATPEEREGFVRATHPESTANYFATRARRRRAARQTEQENR